MKFKELRVMGKGIQVKFLEGDDTFQADVHQYERLNVTQSKKNSETIYAKDQGYSELRQRAKEVGKIYFEQIKE